MSNIQVKVMWSKFWGSSYHKECTIVIWMLYRIGHKLMTNVKFSQKKVKSQRQGHEVKRFQYQQIYLAAGNIQ